MYPCGGDGGGFYKGWRQTRAAQPPRGRLLPTIDMRFAIVPIQTTEYSVQDMILTLTYRCRLKTVNLLLRFSFPLCTQLPGRKKPCQDDRSSLPASNEEYGVQRSQKKKKKRKKERKKRDSGRRGKKKPD
ncbi:hypothetical protein P175DRAFT_028909 [Aspergillus ochraceoroseus IBT 24754]|uniref:Uncharacterized protein n=1 Tax=Aspergillus ochraceoroseus IBT 24754 TaxID=1392256 RepID=A0A2T5M729_9EURO|nr:uncharacterized protein P175DRAFT_028909 [Aspergillus ochraceoroseus IBT 24754]PTU24333.1 hypothetical protein P175DRAFT_028909 [Aspergillus ochraceoroseus IBT 24754]